MTQRAISLPFSFSTSGEVSYTEDIQKIWQDRVVLVVMTYLSERVMRPNFGTLSRNATFENTAEAINLIKSEVAAGFSFHLSELTFMNVKPTIDPVEGLLELEVTYKYGNLNKPESVIVRTTTFTRSGDIIREGA